LETALAVRRHRVEGSTELKAGEIDENGELATGERAGKIDTHAAGQIVGCDGSHSTVRKTVTPEVPGATLVLHGLIGACDIAATSGGRGKAETVWWELSTTTS